MSTSMLLILFCALLLGLGLFLFQFLTWRASTVAIAALVQTQTALRTEMAGLTQQLTLIGQAAVPISVALQTILVKELTHFHTPQVDALLAKLGPPFTLTAEEELTLLAALKQREEDMGDEISESEREAAHILPAIINRVKRDLQATTPTTLLAFQMVSIVPRDEEAPTAP